MVSLLHTLDAFQPQGAQEAIQGDGEGEQEKKAFWKHIWINIPEELQMGKFKPGVNVILYFQKEEKKVNFQEPEK